jgi:cyclopropane fatty-acyl-phospholipid synthase-like methyltransferase
MRETDERAMTRIEKLRLGAIAACLLTILLGVASLRAQNDRAHSHSFSDTHKWSATFDDPERDKWQMPDRIIGALALRPTDLVADIGAGTGYLAVRIARYLKSGTVFALDVEPKMVEHLAERAKANGIANLRAVAATEASANIPEKVDVVVLLNAYHHISGRPDYFKRLQSSLRLGARVAIIDYRPDSPVGAPKHFRLPTSQIEAEMTAAGFRLAGSHDFLPYQNFLVFRLPD